MSNARNLADLLAPGETTLQTVAIETDRIILNGTDGSASNAGDDLLLDASAASTDVGERFTYEDGTDDASVVSSGFSNLDISKDSTIKSEGGSVTTNIGKGLTSAWVNYDSVNQTTDGSLNQSSLTDNAEGYFTSTYVNNLSGGLGDKCIFTHTWNTVDDGGSGNSGQARGGSMSSQAGEASLTTNITWRSYYGSTGSADGALEDMSGSYCMTLGDLA